jgi:hypothetical protein
VLTQQICWSITLWAITFTISAFVKSAVMLNWESNSDLHIKYYHSTMGVVELKNNQTLIYYILLFTVESPNIYLRIIRRLLFERHAGWPRIIHRLPLESYEKCPRIIRRLPSNHTRSALESYADRPRIIRRLPSNHTRSALELYADCPRIIRKVPSNHTRSALESYADRPRII